MRFLYKMISGPTFFLLVVTMALANACNIRKVENGFICVCNSTYCDTVPKIEGLDFGKYQVYSTSKFRPGFNTRIGYFSKEKNSLTTIIKIEKKQHQRIFGFGGAFTDATGINIRKLPKRAQEKLMNSYFGKDGIEYSLCRVPIGGTDFSIRPYTYDDCPGDNSLEHFKLQEEDKLYKIPFIQEGKRLRQNLKLFASAWTAPPWMKTEHLYTGYSLLKEEHFQLWANYTIKFFDEYKKHDIHFWGMTTGNEPKNGFNSHSSLLINSMGWVPTMQNKWIRENLGPSIDKSYKGLKIMIHDDNRLTIPHVVPLMLEDEITLSYIDGIAVHWYDDTEIPTNVLSLTKSEKKDVFLLLSEACIFVEGVILGSWERAARYIASILEYLKYGAVGWIDWNMALNLTGGPTYINYLADSPIIVNETAEEFYKQPMFYAMGHFSKFVVPDSVRLSVSSNIQNNKNNVTSLAFLRPDNLIALVVFNNGSSDVSIQVESENLYSDSIDVEANSIYTILFPKYSKSDS